MKPELVQYICSPTTHNPLELIAEETEGDEIIKGKLIDSETRQEFPILQGVPRFVFGQTKLEDNYTSTFGHQWVTYNWLREEDRQESESMFDHPLESFKDKVIFDAGCGGGRIARFLAPQAKMYIGVDYSVAVNRAYDLCGLLPRTHFIQADLNCLPFRKEPSFDFVFSHGVLHHSPNTKKSFSNLPPLVKSGGLLYVAVFRKSFFLFRWSDGFFRWIINRMPLEDQEKWCERMLLLQRLPYPSFWKRFFWFSLQKRPEVAKFCNYDWYAPKYHHEHTAVEVMNWFADRGFNEIQYINAWPYCPPKEKYRIPTFWNSFRLGQLVGVMGRKI